MKKNLLTGVLFLLIGKFAFSQCIDKKLVQEGSQFTNYKYFHFTFDNAPAYVSLVAIPEHFTHQTTHKAGKGLPERGSGPGVWPVGRSILHRHTRHACTSKRHTCDRKKVMAECVISAYFCPAIAHISFLKIRFHL